MDLVTQRVLLENSGKGKVTMAPLRSLSLLLLCASATWIPLARANAQEKPAAVKPIVDPTFRQKIVWWRDGLDADADLRGRFQITGKRVDSPAPPLLSDPVSGVNGGEIEHGIVKGPPFIMSGVNFPTLGCWEVTGGFDQDELTFVIWLAPWRDAARVHKLGNT
jgi:hypothetical protein